MGCMRWRRKEGRREEGGGHWVRRGEVQARVEYEAEDDMVGVSQGRSASVVVGVGGRDGDSTLGEGAGYVGGRAGGAGGSGWRVVAGTSARAATTRGVGACEAATGTPHDGYGGSVEGGGGTMRVCVCGGGGGGRGVAGLPSAAQGVSTQGMVRERRRASAARLRCTSTKAAGSGKEEGIGRFPSWQ